MADDFDILERVKSDLGLTGNSFHDSTLSGYIAEVKEYLLDAGVSEAVVNSESSAGVISRGVSDLWNYGSGGTGLSPYFRERAIQLVYKTAVTSATETEKLRALVDALVKEVENSNG